MKRFLLSVALLAGLAGTALGQPGDDSAMVVDSARSALVRLCSADFAGRGYVRDGHLKAAAYIRERFQMLDLDSIVMQPFEFDVNVVTSTPALQINGKNLILGTDFLPNDKSGSGEQTANSVIADVGGRLDRAARSGTLFVIDEVADTSVRPDLRSKDMRIRLIESADAPAVIVRVERLTGDIAGGTDGDTQKLRRSFPVLEVLKTAMPDTVREVSLSIRSEVRHVRSLNVLARIPGTAVPDSTIILCAHYDHLGAMGDSVWFPGANDNASGTAMLIAMARQLRLHPLRYTVVLIAFSGEETGLLGSAYYTGHPLYNLSRTRFVLNMDMTASGRDGVMACGGSDFPQEFALMQAVSDSLNLGELRKRAGAPNSDQYFFVQHGLRGFYVYPFTGYQPYHSLRDVPETLQLDVFYKMYRLFSGFVRRL